jgi:hypothetical protein
MIRSFPLVVAVPQTLQLYFQQILPLADCNANDGKVVGQLLIDVVESKPTDLPHAIRTFANRTAMLRECGFRHIGDALLALLMTIDKSASSDDVPAAALAVARDASSLTAEQASAIGSMIASKTRSHAPASALHRAVHLHPVLQAMRSQHAWFMPMLEVLVAANAIETRRISTLGIGKRFSAIITPAEPSETLIDVPPDDRCSAVRP